MSDIQNPHRKRSSHILALVERAVYPFMRFTNSYRREFEIFDTGQMYNNVISYLCWGLGRFLYWTRIVWLVVLYRKEDL